MASKPGISTFDGIRRINFITKTNNTTAKDIMVVCGGVIPAQDYDYLYQNGAAAIFGPGTVIPDSARKILQLLLEQVAE